MAKLFYKNLSTIFFRNLAVSFLTTILVTFVAGFFSMLVIVICQELLKINLSVLTIMIIDGSLALVASFVWLGVAAGLNWGWFFGGENDRCRKPPHIIVGFLSLFIIPFIFAGTSVLFACTGYEELVLVTANNDNYNFLVILFPAVTVSQILYFLAIIIHYCKWQVCWHCGRIFCFDYSYTGSTSWTETSYKTYKTKENLGSIYAGDRKIMDVEGNVSHGYSETRHYKENCYTGTCSCCDCKKYNSKLFSSEK